jgi:acetyl-CoA carboxylase carboxyl transferase subunit beta
MSDWPDKKPGGLDASEKSSFAKGVFRKCDGCGETMPSESLDHNYEVCPHCGHHHRLAAARWRELVLDEGKLDEWDGQMAPGDPLSFVDGKPYPDRVKAYQKSARSTEAIEIGRGKIEGIPIAYGAFVFAFMGGSMGSVVGEKVTLLFERGASLGLPVVLLQASGGARMQEGILSLMQMAKTVAARERLRDAGVPFLSVLLNPTTGGVAASFSFLGDLNIAEPNALIGFAGPRVIETTIRQTLPEGFQRSEFLLEHGMIDRIVSRLALKKELATIVRLLQRPAAPGA